MGISAAQKKERKDRQKEFLEAFYEMGTIERAADTAKIARKTIYNWIHKDKAFASRLEKVRPLAKDNYVGVLEHEAHRRAVQGIDKGVFFKGNLIATIKEYSDTLLIVLLKANAPEKYRERTEVTGAGGKPIEVEVNAKDKLISLLNSIASRDGKAAGNNVPEPEGS